MAIVEDTQSYILETAHSRTLYFADWGENEAAIVWRDMNGRREV